MKINKHNPKHWLYLCTSGVWVLLSVLLRPFFIFSSKSVLGLYGHQFNGNLAAIYHQAIKKDKNCYYFLLDPNLAKHLKSQGVNAVALTHWHAAIKLAKTKKMLTDHGLHTLILLKKLTKVKFFDVWHGIPFKGFDQNDFKLQRQYEEVWVTSCYIRSLYIEKFKFSEDKVKVIGYARTDKLIKDNNFEKIKKLKVNYNLAVDKKIWLFAPTWKQDNNNRSIFPFAKENEVFLNELNKLALEQQAIVILRTHLNSNISLHKEYSSIRFLAASEHPDTEDILLISDILICDWSSIAFDFLLLNRPTLFLDIPAPFKKGLSLDSTNRFGEIVTDFEQLLTELKCLSQNDEYYWKKNLSRHMTIKQKIYDNNADGRSSERALQRLAIIYNILDK